MCSIVCNPQEQLRAMPPLVSYIDNVPIQYLDERFACTLKITDDPVVSHVPAKSKKRVRFASEKQIVNPVKEYYTDEDIQTKWWTADGLYDIKVQAKKMSSTIRRQGSSQSCRITMAHRKTSLMLAGDFKSLLRLTQTSPDQDLQQWCSNDDGRRGLERFSSRDYCCLRRRDIMGTRKAVLTEQKLQSQTRVRDEEAIARLSREASRRERTFSAYLAEADAKQLRGERPRPKTTTTTKSQRREAPPQRRAPPRKRSRIEDPGELPTDFSSLFSKRAM